MKYDQMDAKGKAIMNRKYWLALAVVCGVLAGCNRNDSTLAAGGSDLSTNDVKQQAQQTYNSAKEQAFVDSAQEKLKDLDAKMDELSKQAANAKPDIRQQVQSSLDKLKKQRTTVQQKLDDLKAGGKEGWEKTKDAFSTAWQDLEKTYQDTKAKLQQ